ncbi:MAG: hypothetical protein HY038_13635 [Nitrospirae bacterium]|nr:hypothetical protein [Nitrospirota bacterium]
MLAERRQAQSPDREKIRAKLTQVEQEIENIMAAIKQGILTVSTKAALEKAEGERTELQQALQMPQSKLGQVTQLLPGLKERFQSLVANIASVANRNVDKAREGLKALLGAQITLHPCSDGQERYLTAEVSGSYEGLLQLAGMKNKFGGGQGS